MGRSLAAIAVIAGLALAACSSPPPRTAHAVPSPAKCPGSAAGGRAGGPAQRPGLEPSIGAAAFAGHGKLAFVSSGRLYVLDGSAARLSATLHTVAAPAGAVAPAWSPDGRWLAFIVAPPSPYPAVSAPSGTLWLARADGDDARPVLADAGPFSWSPAADVLAATITDPATGHTQACELQPGATPRLLPGVTGSAIWSPDGRQLAFTSIQSSPQAGFTGSTLETIPAAGGTPAVRARSAQDALLAAGWWPDGQGLLAWSDPQDSASLAADGLPLVSYPLSGTRPVTLATTLVHPSFLATTPSLRLVATDAGSDRILWNGKTIVLCAVTGGCTGFPGEMPGPVNLDPAWSPAGEPVLAFVHGSASAPRPPEYGQAAIVAWYATRRLWVYILGGNPHLISGAGTSIAAPAWSADGRFILYVRDNGLWLINPFAGHGNPSPGLPSQTGGPALRIVGQLFAGTWPDYYGYMYWQGQFAWHG